jgi:hypothetical protein
MWSKLSRELYFEIRSFFIEGYEYEYQKLLNCSKVFKQMKYETQFLKLTKQRAYDYATKETFRQEVRLQVQDPLLQLSLRVEPNLFFYINFYDHPFTYHSLEIHYSHKLSRVTNFTSLKSLKLKFCDGIQEVNCLGHLEKLELVHCKNLIDVTGLGSIPILKITHCINLMDISSLTNNKSLTVDNCGKILDCSCFQNIPRVSSDLLKTVVDLQQLTNPKHLGIWHNITDFSCCLGSLQCLELRSCNTIQILQGVSRIPHLRISVCPFLTSLGDLSAEYTKSVVIEYSTRLKSFSPLKDIRSVEIWNCPTFLNGSEVENVHHLVIDSCGIVDISMLGKIKHLELHGCSRIKVLQGLAEVQSVVINVCVGIKSLEGLGGNNQRISITHDDDMNGFSGITIPPELENYLKFQERNTMVLLKP